VFSVKNVKKEAKKDFEKAWIDSLKYLPEGGFELKKKKGRPHQLWDTLFKIREIFLNAGFNEIENKVFVDDIDVYKQYGPEAPLIMDRCYYLASLPRPDIVISKQNEKQIAKIIPWSASKKKKLTELFKAYKKGKIEGDDFVGEMVKRLGIKAEQATTILSLFSKFSSLKPRPTTQTLRSHMTTVWFETLAALKSKEVLPVQLFSIGMRFRREHKVDASHLRAHYGASSVIMAEDISIDEGKEVTRRILEPLGFKDLIFIQKEATAKYYAPGTEYKVYVKIGRRVYEIANIGMYSPLALTNYDIPYPVFKAGFGLERIVMVMNGTKDVREIIYPQFYLRRSFSDKDIARLIKIKVKPNTKFGKKLVELIEQTALEHGETPSPCEFKVIEDKKLRVKLVEYAPNTKLCGPAYLNSIYVHDGNIISQSENGKDQVNTGISMLKAYANMAARRIEEMKEKTLKINVRNINSPNEININIPKAVENYIVSQNKQISIHGPFFMTLTAQKM
jgi:O-phosphoseryl-tRNA synthetase